MRLSTLRTVGDGVRWFEPNVILSEFSVATLRKMRALELASRLRPDVPVIVISEGHNEQLELEALREGAFDCVPRNDKARLLAAMTHALSVFP